MAMPQTTNPPRLGRCKECDFALFVANDSDATDADSFREVKVAGQAYRVGNEGYFARCPNRHRLFVLRQIKGTYSPDHQCDARCLNAKGHTCTCSCGGANHGRGYAATVVTATPAPALTTTRVTEPASERQVNFIKKLLEEREVPDRMIPNPEQDSSGFITETGEQRKGKAFAKLNAREFTKGQASKTIEWLLTLPRKEES